MKDSRELAHKIGTMAPDTSVKLDLLRNGEAKTMTLTLGEMPNEQQAKADTGRRRADQRRAASRPLARSGERRRRRRRPGRRGDGVDPDGPAAEHGFQTGDVILDVGGKAVANAGDVRKALTDAQGQGKHHVLMRVKTGDGMRFVALPLGDA